MGAAGAVSPEMEAALKAADDLALAAYLVGKVATSLEEPRRAYVRARQALGESTVLDRPQFLN